MTGFGSPKHLAPFRLWRSGVVLAGAFACWLALSPPSQAQVRFHGEAGGTYTVNVISWRDIPFRTVVRQQYDYSCGSAALATLLRFHYGVRVGETEIFRSMFERGDQARIRQVGFSMLDMRSYLEARGFRADGLRLSLDRLAALNMPVIALITRGNYRHFVVIKGVSGNRVLIGDPTFGLQTYSRADFQAVWNGVVLAIRQSPAGTQAPTFNSAEEWRPWAVAPVRMAPQAVSPSDLLREMPELYQITAATTPP